VANVYEAGRNASPSPAYPELQKEKFEGGAHGSSSWGDELSPWGIIAQKYQHESKPDAADAKPQPGKDHGAAVDHNKGKDQLSKHKDHGAAVGPTSARTLPWP